MKFSYRRHPTFNKIYTVYCFSKRITHKEIFPALICQHILSISSYTFQITSVLIGNKFHYTDTSELVILKRVLEFKMIWCHVICNGICHSYFGLKPWLLKVIRQCCGKQDKDCNGQPHIKVWPTVKEWGSHYSLIMSCSGIAQRFTDMVIGGLYFNSGVTKVWNGVTGVCKNIFFASPVGLGHVAPPFPL